MAIFQPSGPGSFEMSAVPGVLTPDPGIPLLEYDPNAPIEMVEWDSQTFGPAWRNQPSVRKVVSYVARQVASTPLALYQMVEEHDRIRVRTGALADLLKRPSRAPGQTPFRFWESVLIDGLLNDRWCISITQHDDGSYELVRIPASIVRFQGDYLGRIAAVLIADEDGQMHSFDPANFIIDVGYAERSANGTSPLKTLEDLLLEYRESVQYRRQIWKNGARMPGWIERSNPWPSDSAYERFKRSFEEFKRDGGRAGGTPVLEDGMQYHEVQSFRPKDTLDLEGRQLTDVEVASAYHIAPELVGAREGTFANVSAFKEMLYGPSLGAYFDAWQQTLNLSLLPLLGGADQYIEANVETKLRGSFEQQASVMSTAIGAPWMTRNEGRALQNLPAVEGGNELITPLNVLIGGQASPQDGKALNTLLSSFAARQRDVVASRKAAGQPYWWDRERWDRELRDDLKALDAGTDWEGLIRDFNDAAEAAYHSKEQS
jgi:HK97 family phage portal protein